MEFNLKSNLFSLKDEFKKFSLKKKISDEDFEIIWKEVTDKINNESPSKIAFIGNCGVGKSSTINSLFNAGQRINHTEAFNQEEGLIEIKAETLEGENGFLDIYNISGLDDSFISKEKNLETYKKVLSDIDVIIWVLDVQNIELNNTQETLINEIREINPALINRIVFALNKVEIIHPGQSDWNPLMNLPSEEQEVNIVERVKDVEEIIKEIIPEWNGQIVGYSAEKKYNLTKLFKIILEAVPEERKWEFASRKALSEFIELVDDRFLPEELKEKKKDLKKTNR
ncbi:MAG: GTP-binding protein HSR1 [Bacteroidales bacterium]|nr:GTP-binding protein HSR1 [Bacteroidales bacterium]